MRVDNQTSLRGGFVAIQLIDLSEVGIEDAAPLRLLVTFTVKTPSGSTGIFFAEGTQDRTWQVCEPLSSSESLMEGSRNASDESLGRGTEHSGAS